jgi:serine/threonine protein kinase
VLVVKKSPNWSVQITDFGITKKLQEGQTVQGTLYQGTAGFMAPEMIIPSLRGPLTAIDMWALGSMAFFMLTNRIFLLELAELYQYAVGNAEKPSCDYVGVHVTSMATEFVSTLLARSPHHRPTADDALSSAWVASLAMYICSVFDAYANTPKRQSDSRRWPSYICANINRAWTRGISLEHVE